MCLGWLKNLFWHSCDYCRRRIWTTTENILFVILMVSIFGGGGYLAYDEIAEFTLRLTYSIIGLEYKSNHDKSYLDLAIPAHYLLDVDKYLDEKHEYLDISLRTAEEDENSRRQILSKLSTSDLERYTPEPDTILKGCGLRQLYSENDPYKYYGADICNEVMDIYKEVSNGEIVYRIMFPDMVGPLIYNQIASDPNMARVIRSLFFNDYVFRNVHKFRAAFFLEINGTTTVYKALAEAVMIDRVYNEVTGTYTFNEYGFGHHSVSENNLEPPYGECVPGNYSGDILQQDCVRKQTNRRLNRESPMSVITSAGASGLKMLTSEDLDDPVKSKIWRKIHEECSKDHPRGEACYDVRLITRMDQVLRGNGLTLVIHELLYTMGDMIITYKPKTTWKGLIIALFGIVATLLGWGLRDFFRCKWNRTTADDRCCFCCWKGQVPDPIEVVTEMATENRQNVGELRISMGRVNELEQRDQETRERLEQLEWENRNLSDQVRYINSRSPDTCCVNIVTSPKTTRSRSAGRMSHGSHSGISSRGHYLDVPSFDQSQGFDSIGHRLSTPYTPRAVSQGRDAEVSGQSRHRSRERRSHNNGQYLDAGQLERSRAFNSTGHRLPLVPRASHEADDDESDSSPVHRHRSRERRSQNRELYFDAVGLDRSQVYNSIGCQLHRPYTPPMASPEEDADVLTPSPVQRSRSNLREAESRHRSREGRSLTRHHDRRHRY